MEINLQASVNSSLSESMVGVTLWPL